LAYLDDAEHLIEDASAEIAEHLQPADEAVPRLDTLCSER
jgi:hypothetical protein